MKKALWNQQAISGKLLSSPAPDLVKEIFYREFFDQISGKWRAKRLKDTSGYTVIAIEENYEHIFFKKGAFLIERGERIYWIRETILTSRFIFEDKEHKRRYHYLQPYKVNEQLESFCVITKRSGKALTSIIVTAFPIEWDRVYTFLQQK